MKYIIIHHSGGTDANPKADSSNYTVAQCNQDHKIRFNMLSSLGYYVGYHYIITKDGTITQCRKDDEESAATIGHNKDSLNVMLCGNFDIQLPTTAQIEALKGFLQQKADLYSIPLYNIVPHRHFAQKSCYGNLLHDNWGQQIYLGGKISFLRRLMWTLFGI